MPQKKRLKKEKQPQINNYNDDDVVAWAREDDCFEFQDYYLKHKLTHTTPEFHYEAIQLFENSIYAGLAAPRETAKTTLVSIQYPLWRGIYGKSKFIVLVGEIRDKSLESLKSIRRELETNERICRDFNPTFERDQIDDIIFKTNYGMVRIVAVGCNQSIRGFLENWIRPDLIIVDDFEERKRVLSALNRQDDRNWLYSDVFPALDTYTGKLIVAGTILHVDSVLANITGYISHRKDMSKSPAKGWKTLYYKVIDEKGNSIWPEYKPVKMLLKLKEMLESQGQLHIWFKEYQNDPTMEGDAEFSENWLQFIDLSDPVRKEWWDKKKGKLNYYFTLDTAWSKKESADRTAGVTCGWDEFYNCFVFPPKFGRYSVQEAWDKIIIPMRDLYNPRKYGIEKGATKDALDDVLDRENRLRGWNIRFEDLPIHAGNEALVRAFFFLFARGEVYFVGKPDEFKELLDELRTFPNGTHDDIAVALAHQMQLARPHPATKPTGPAENSGEALLETIRKMTEAA